MHYIKTVQFAYRKCYLVACNVIKASTVERQQSVWCFLPPLFETRINSLHVKSSASGTCDTPNRWLHSMLKRIKKKWTQKEKKRVAWIMIKIKLPCHCLSVEWESLCKWYASFSSLDTSSSKQSVSKHHVKATPAMPYLARKSADVLQVAKRDRDREKRTHSVCINQTSQQSLKMTDRCR